MLGLAFETSAYASIKERQNTIIILDLSDRLLKPKQVQTDLEVLSFIIDQFAADAKSKYYLGFNDRLKIIIAPQDGVSYDVQAYQAQLEEDMANFYGAGIKEKHKLPVRCNALKNTLKKLYAEASKPQSHTQYQGANLWKFFNEDLAFELQPTVNYGNQQFNQQHKIIVLTDGYLDFEDYSNKRKVATKTSHTNWVPKLAKNSKENWKENYHNQNLGILPLTRLIHKGPLIPTYVIGVNPKADYHLEILEQAWTDWLRTGNLSLKSFWKNGINLKQFLN